MSTNNTWSRARVSDKDQDFTRKIAVILDKSLEPWQAFNAATHIAAYIGNALGENFSTGRYFITRDSVAYPRNTQYPIIILRAKTSQLRSLVARAREQGLLHNEFIREMIETTDDQEIVSLLAQKDDESVQYLGVGLFGLNDQVNAITKSLQLWR